MIPGPRIRRTFFKVLNIVPLPFSAGGFTSGSIWKDEATDGFDLCCLILFVIWLSTFARHLVGDELANQKACDRGSSCDPQGF